RLLSSSRRRGSIPPQCRREMCGPNPRLILRPCRYWPRCDPCSPPTLGQRHPEQFPHTKMSKWGLGPTDHAERVIADGLEVAASCPATGRILLRSKWIPGGTVGELQVAEIGSKSQTDA